jgi:hypothetical protein
MCSPVVCSNRQQVEGKLVYAVYVSVLYLAGTVLGLAVLHITMHSLQRWDIRSDAME